jgi:hypothetical protein
MGNDYQLNYLLLLGFAVIFLVSMILLAQVWAPPGYNWRQNTISELATQGHPHQWIMQLGFIGFGLLVNLSLLVKTWTHQQIFWPDGWLMVYGSAISLSGIFCTAPIDNTVRYDSREAGWHSKCALMAGIAFSLCIFGYLMLSPVPLTKRVHLVFLVLVMGFSAVFGAAERQSIPIGRGIVQRLLYFTSFLWLLIGQ